MGKKNKDNSDRERLKFLLGILTGLLFFVGANLVVGSYFAMQGDDVHCNIFWCEFVRECGVTEKYVETQSVTVVDVTHECFINNVQVPCSELNVSIVE